MPLSYQWKADGVPIPGETSNSYAITAADANKVISCEVTGTNPMGSVSVNSSNPVTIPLPSPVNTVAPVVTGSAIENMVLTVSNDGTWTGVPPLTYTYRWRRNTILIVGATSSTYTLQAADVGRNVDCLVRATNAYGWSEQLSNPIGPVISAVPINVTPPNIMGVAIDGQVLTVTNNGTWTGYPPLTYTYQWRRNGSNIGGATSSTYTLVSADIGANIDCMVTATNVYGSASSDSNDIGPIAGVAPSNISAPIASGTAQDGQVLTTTNGVWAGSTPITYTYQWRRNGSNIGGATASTYTLVTADVGTNVDCMVTATNPYGSASMDSNDIGPVVSGLLLDSYATNTAYAWSVARKLKSTATVAIRIRRSNDNAETDIGFSGGALDTAAITSFVGANSAFITRIYEQVGSGYDWQQTTAANQFRIVNAGTLDLLNTKPTAVCDIATSCRMTIPSSTTYFLFMRNGTESSLFSVYKKGITTTSSRALIATSNTGVGGTNNGWGVLNWTDGKTYIQAYQSSSYNYNGTAAASTPDAQALLTFYVDANNATASQRTIGYLNGGSPVNDNTQNWGTYSGNNNVDFSLGNGLTASTPISRFQELILLPSQPTLSTFRNNINGFYNIYTIPVNTVAPVISGGTNVGYTLSSNTGTWSDSYVTYTYQWKRNGSDIIGETSNTYSIVNADIGSNITCAVTATNAAGSASANSSNSIVPNSSATLLDSYATNTAYGWSVSSKLKNTATNAIRVRRSNDNAETDIGFVNNVLDTTTLLSFVGANSAFITKIYEQVGSGYDFSQTTAANQPRIVNAGTLEVLNSRPAAAGYQNSVSMNVPSSTSYFNFLHNGTSSSVFSVHAYTANSACATFNTTSSATGVGIRIVGGTNTLANTCGNGSALVLSNTASNTLVAGTQYLFSVLIDADNATAANRSEIYYNGGAAQKNNATSGSVSASNSAINGTIMTISTTTITHYQELILFPSQPTLATIRTDINSRYNIY